MKKMLLIAAVAAGGFAMPAFSAHAAPPDGARDERREDRRESRELEDLRGKLAQVKSDMLAEEDRYEDKLVGLRRGSREAQAVEDEHRDRMKELHGRFDALMEKISAAHASERFDVKELRHKLEMEDEHIAAEKERYNRTKARMRVGSPEAAEENERHLARLDEIEAHKQRLLQAIDELEHRPVDARDVRERITKTEAQMALEDKRHDDRMGALRDRKLEILDSVRVRRRDPALFRDRLADVNADIKAEEDRHDDAVEALAARRAQLHDMMVALEQRR